MPSFEGVTIAMATYFGTLNNDRIVEIIDALFVKSSLVGAV